MCSMWCTATFYNAFLGNQSTFLSLLYPAHSLHKANISFTPLSSHTANFVYSGSYFNYILSSNALHNTLNK